MRKQRQTATDMTERQVELHAAEELHEIVVGGDTHSSVSPGILSLSRWAFMAELCSFALLWS